MITRSDSKSGLYPSPETSQPGIARRFGDIEPSLWPKLRPSMMYCACAADIAIVDQASARRLHGDIYIPKGEGMDGGNMYRRRKAAQFGAGGILGRDF